MRTIKGSWISPLLFGFFLIIIFYFLIQMRGDENFLKVLFIFGLLSLLELAFIRQALFPVWAYDLNGLYVFGSINFVSRKEYSWEDVDALTITNPTVNSFSNEIFTVILNDEKELSLGPVGMMGETDKNILKDFLSLAQKNASKAKIDPTFQQRFDSMVKSRN